jgi:hypothetical protein
MARLSAICHRMHETGIGYAGIPGVWWRPATVPVSLPTSIATDLTQIGKAIFLLFDTVMALYGTPQGAAAGLERLLEGRVPPELLALRSRTPVQSVRPDFQLVPQADGQYRLVATELEICPSAQGFAHAMQVGYGLTPDLADGVAAWLAGRPLLFVGTEQWSEFLWEQLAFCRALAERGAQGYVLYDRPLTTLAAEIQAGRRWQPPLFGVETKPVPWDDDLLGRIIHTGLDAYWWPDDHTWPDRVGEAVIFRFGYLDCFGPQERQRFLDWEANGATLLNPPAFFLDSKTMMAALGLPGVRALIAETSTAMLATLDHCIPETWLVEESVVQRLAQEQAGWVLKVAGFDQSNQAWGGRSLRLGANCTRAEWQSLLAESLQLPWPTVAQRVTPSAQLAIDYFDDHDQVQQLMGTSRLRSFLWRSANGIDAWAAGTHLTLVGGSGKVAESTQAVQAPVRFEPPS